MKPIIFLFVSLLVAPGDPPSKKDDAALASAATASIAAPTVYYLDDEQALRYEVFWPEALQPLVASNKPPRKARREERELVFILVGGRYAPMGEHPEFAKGTQRTCMPHAVVVLVHPAALTPEGLPVWRTRFDSFLAGSIDESVISTEEYLSRVVKQLDSNPFFRPGKMWIFAWWDSARAGCALMLERKKVRFSGAYIVAPIERPDGLPWKNGSADKFILIQDMKSSEKAATLQTYLHLGETRTYFLWVENPEATPFGFVPRYGVGDSQYTLVLQYGWQLLTSPFEAGR